MAEFVGGWIPSSPEEKEKHERLFPLTALEWAAPEVVETELYVPTGLVNWYDQIGGTCVGYSGSWCTTVRNSTPDTTKKYRALLLYKKCREIMGEDPNDINGGATMPSCGKALKNFGHVLVIGNTDQGWNIEEGIESYYWGLRWEDARLAISQNKPVHFGIPWHSKFMTPKLIAGEYWIGTEDLWGGMVGGHAIMGYYWSDKRNAIRLRNTWGGDYPDVWLGAKAINTLLSEQGEMMICVDRPNGPVGKLELVEPFTIAPSAPKAGDKIAAHMHVKNTGEGKLTAVALAIEDMVDGVGKAGFGFTSDFDLEPGQEYDHNPTRPDALTAGHWRFRGDYKQYGTYHVLGTVEVDVADEPPPPPPEPTETLTVNPETLTIDGVTYSTEADQPDGVVFRRVST